MGTPQTVSTPEHRDQGPGRISVIAFDWGGTLMEDPGLYPGPMAHWPRVAAVPHAAAVLAALAARYRLVVATNADDSDAALVLAALARVGLDRHISAVFSSADLGVQKPDRRFYESMAERLGVRPADMVMVGDSYANDVAGAAAAGLRTVWLDRYRRPRPHPPAADAEVRSLAELPAAV
ncbi:MAG: HAD family hydrolase, partial [Actinobacteria bacterium]|nr:HAD family hydrolase [Actinomycetota bacterium]